MRITMILLVVLMACQNIKKTKHESKDASCSDSLKYTMLISATIDLPNLQQYYKVQETLNQKELIILDNLSFKGIGKLNKFNNPIKLMNATEISEKEIKAYLDYKEINIKNDTAYVYYRYDVQGIGIKSTYLLKNCQWQLINSHLWEN
jgi:hypothetical protein